jgi:PTS system mannose-specific IID component
VNAPVAVIGGMDLVRVFLRSFLIQASWSYDRMQSLGFAFAVLPALRKLYPDPGEYRARLQLHMEYFNTQPYLAGFILGAVVRMEEERASGRNPTADVPALKNTLMAPLGALGDSFFWGSLKPLAILISLACLLSGAWWAPLLFLFLYNSVHLWVRAGVLLSGYRTAGDVVALIARYQFTRMARLFKAASLTVLGGMLGMLPLWRPEFRPLFPLPDGVLAATGLAITLLFTAVLKKGGSPVKLMIGLAAVCIALAYAGVA